MQLSDRERLRRFLVAYGVPRGSRYYVAGLTDAEATARHGEELEAENIYLRGELTRAYLAGVSRN